ncbi:conjugative transfer region protein [Legionella busanensis]|uniref:Conjugative transfer region protein n=1 Tax=Legionella busanensis TaxID=190655 RepID=A0A378K9E5_9GAMM|nr:DUF3487 family protein [Legionella busanensis]STX81568.1 conjugative transfer region protein [Legionella busanensis]
MNGPSSRTLTHEFIAYQGLTLRELLVTGLLGMGVTCFFTTIIGGLLGWTGTAGALGLVLGFFLSVRVFPYRLARHKQGKPTGFLRKKLVIQVSRVGLIKSPYLCHQGFWRKARLLGGRDV